MSISAYLFNKILGKPEVEKEIKINFPYNLSVKETLNVYQTEAVKKALTSPFCLIQGPPGTGKTVVSGM